MRVLRRSLPIIPLIAVLVAPAFAADDEDESVCLTCHELATPGLVGQWRASRHAEMGVSCEICHTADEDDVDAMDHYGNTVAVIVTPKDCGMCHDQQVAEQQGSHHAKAGQILGSLDNLLGEVVGGPPAVTVGCRQCHGSVVKVDEDGRPTPDTWPNTGMGRINPDGSTGSCSACHARHEFSVRQARQPEACGKCHLGPDHPQTEVWNESKHGVMYHANRENMNLDADEWRAGQEYFSGPTCASCHMGAAGDLAVTHDVGERISWTLRPAISKKLNMVIFEDNDKTDILGDSPELPEVGAAYDLDGESKTVAEVLTWEDRRGRMQDVCRQCHAPTFVDAAYMQIDDAIGLYDEKFATPAKAIVDDLKASGAISAEDFDDGIEWIYWELWHHEGRRARHGAAMQGPDYAWWHGIYDVAKSFYTEFLPEVEELVGEEQAKALFDKHLYTQPGHEWYRDGMSKDALQRIQEFYQQRYNE